MNPNAKIAPVDAIQPASRPTPGGGDFAQSRSQAQADAAARYRLVIEEGPRAGSFVYKTLDRVTGEVVRQLPREEVVRLMDSDAYGAGSVIDTNA